MQILQRAQPIATLINAPTTDSALKTQLSTVLALRDFASRALGLPDNGSYRSYADLQRPYVVWNVFATPEFSTRPVTSCFLFAGCVDYRGYFSQTQAERYAQGLREQGYDVFMGGIPAYSTLGWFNDPVLNTFTHYPETELARLLFHELAHQVVYVRDDSTFNESFAGAVEQEGVQRWLAAHGSAEQRLAFEAAQRRKQELSALILSYRQHLQRVYDSALGTQQKRLAKTRLLDELRARYAQLKATWGGFSHYDAWFARDLNNAQLAAVSTYTELVPAFQALLAAEHGDLTRFYRSVRRIARLPQAERNSRLHALAATSVARAE